MQIIEQYQESDFELVFDENLSTEKSISDSFAQITNKDLLRIELQSIFDRTFKYEAVMQLNLMEYTYMSLLNPFYEFDGNVTIF